MTVVLRAGGVTDVGRLRTINQDSFILLADRDLYVVADGMGGHQGGEVASRLAIDTLQAAYHDPTPDSLSDAMAVANHRIHLQADDDPDLRGMGTTVVAAALVPVEGDDAEDRHQLVIANVGDSRAYLFRDSSLIQLTEDHSLVADLVREGRITPEEAEAHPQRNIVTRVLGVYEHVEVDLWPVDPVEGDRVLLCSDGLFNEVGDDQISAVLRRLDDPHEAAAELVRLANEGGGRDNITVVVLDVVDDGGVAEAASSALAGEAGAAGSDRDLAGFGTALDDDRPARTDVAPPSRRARRRARRTARRAERSQRTRLTWRALVFSAVVVAVVAGAFATIQWYGMSTYYVGFDGDEVAIFRGRPGGLLWIEPELEERTGIERGDVPASYLAALETGREQATRTEAERYVSNIERDLIEAAEDEERTTTSTTAAVTTTAPAASP